MREGGVTCKHWCQRSEIHSGEKSSWRLGGQHEVQDHRTWLYSVWAPGWWLPTTSSVLQGSRNPSSSEGRTRSTSPDGRQQWLEAQIEHEDTICIDTARGSGRPRACKLASAIIASQGRASLLASQTRCGQGAQLGTASGGAQGLPSG